MASLKCLLCGYEYEAPYFRTKWLYSCPECCSLSMSKVNHISDKEYNGMINTIKKGIESPIISDNSVLYSLHDSRVAPSEISNILPLLTILFDQVILDGAIGVLDCPKNYSKTVYDLVKENVIILSELRPSPFDGITKYPLIFLEDTPWEKDKELLYYPFLNLDSDASLNLYFALENLSLTLATSEIENLYKWSKLQPPGVLWNTLEQLGYMVHPDTLWYNFPEINYNLLLSNELKSQLILNKSREGLISLKYGISNPQQRKLNSLLKLIKMRRVYLPEFSTKIIKKLRSSDEVEQLKNVLNNVISNRDYDFASDGEQLINEYDKALESYNRFVGKYGKKGSAILGCFFAIVGGALGGPFGAVIGGAGGATSPFGIEYVIKKHYAKKKVKWPFLFVKG